MSEFTYSEENLKVETWTNQLVIWIFLSELSVVSVVVVVHSDKGLPSMQENTLCTVWRQPKTSQTASVLKEIETNKVKKNAI